MLKILYSRGTSEETAFRIGGEKIVAKYASDMKLISRIYKELLSRIYNEWQN